MSVLSRQQLEFTRSRITDPTAPRRLGKRKPTALVREASKAERARRVASGAKAFDAVVAGRPKKPGKAVTGG